MDTINSSYDLGEKLMIFLKKLREPDLKIADDIFLEKLLTCIRNEVSMHKIKNVSELIEWFYNTTEFWIENPPPTNVFSFVLHLLGIFAGKEDVFNYIQESNILNNNLQQLKVHIYRNNSLKLKYITLLSDCISHKSGCQWVKTTKLWKEVVQLYLLKSGLFLEQQAVQFITKLLEHINWDINTLEEILNEVLVPLEHYVTEFEIGHMNGNSVEIYQKNLKITAEKVLPAFITILETFLVSSNAKYCKSALQSLKIQGFFKYLLKDFDDPKLLEKISVAYFLHSVYLSYDVISLVQMQEIPDFLVDVFKIFVKEKKFYNVIRLAKYCQLFWNKISLNNPSVQNGEVENHFIIIQLVHSCVFYRKPLKSHDVYEMYINKLFDLTTDNTVRLLYFIRDEMNCGDDRVPMDYAFQAVLSVCDNIETLNLKRAVFIFQSLAYILKFFIPMCNEFDERITDEEFKKEEMLCLTHANFLSSVLNTICLLIEKFKINWTKALESLCLLRSSALLLSNPNLPTRVGVQTVSLIKLAISNFMSPNLALLMNNIEGTSLECLMPIIYSKMHDPNWEIRDSCTELIGIIAELSETKYPVFQDILIQGRYCELIINIMEKDSESYVRASAVRALSQMIKVENLRTHILSGTDILSKIILLQINESEGIVRRETALLARELFANQACRADTYENLFRVMGYAAIYDLHWEVKVNALFFWEKVIQTFIADQGMIDGFFPSITFSKENKKIISLTSEEIKSRLNKVLNELSEAGCLHVLLTTLKDDCDFSVVEKSAQISTDLIELLRRYDFFDKDYVGEHQNEKHSVKRKCSDHNYLGKKISNFSLTNNEEIREVDKSDRVIEDIVNKLDLDLLGSVLNTVEVIPFKDTKNFSLQRIKPDLFLLEMQQFNVLSFINAKQKWLLSKEDDFNELLNDILTLSMECETNVLDCY